MRALPLLAGASLALLLAAAACDDATKPPFLPEASPTATAEATPTAPATPTPEARDFPGFKAFATKIVQATATRNGQLFVDRARQSVKECAGTEELGPCAARPAGTELEGLWWGLWRTDAVDLVLPDEIASDFESFAADALIGERDGFGAGNTVLYALAWSQLGIFGEGGAFYAVVTGILPGDAGPERHIAVYQFTFDGERWRLYGVIEAGALFEEWLSGNCTECYDQWERWEGNP
ncbi:MAG: hypothetical protein Q7R32_06380 [Dehalococcoidia bacterium]|nr:hypothetical protein [Dehalococcoidia bacterium]